MKDLVFLCNFIQIIFHFVFFIIYRKLCDWGMVYRMFFLGRNFVSGLLCTI